MVVLSSLGNPGDVPYPAMEVEAGKLTSGPSADDKWPEPVIVFGLIMAWNKRIFDKLGQVQRDSYV